MEKWGTSISLRRVLEELLATANKTNIKICERVIFSKGKVSVKNHNKQNKRVEQENVIERMQEKSFERKILKIKTEKNTKKYNKNFTIVNMEHKASSFSVLLDESIRGNDNENSSLNKIIT